MDGNVKILFANPDQKFTRLYLPYLSAHFATVAVGDGLQAIRKLKIWKPALVVSDYRLPMLSGAALLRFIRRSPEFSAIPFLFLTSHNALADGLGLGATDWIDFRGASPELLVRKINFYLKNNKHYGI